ncbi:hypothetical protein [Bacillus sp. BP-3]|uniref:hypothetical protein n=1 Tax=Bacillus sp. BP-3 TaxID=3022773 RepID=UPI00232CBB95|nr:hypothetical protein [Bacillus sp. BP-3]MDC2865200.1 hypothetical protein [Bacillus sp. BP-3]
MNKDSKTVKTEKGFFESIIAPIISGVIFILLILYKVIEFVMKYVVILIIIASLAAIIVFMYLKEFDGVFGAGLALISSLFGYFIFFKKKKG